ncbi:phospholipid/cholesterol/gamma-HCH transport system substrate-binding protein [Hydrogenivirga caldilitoris]|uniref:Phospholipid/cholesterol/gamma-HCH transport system substrate-binding protein n=1 Tax=Hydrogenivirga caldilitoris TaxID=246264 RepID=A0A497XRD9_9AQUI|nr:MlaD family protein [Hydrogenivirga caldilitoris]RLJ70760.1 phospholipid/cholesterol/gamma-HCH transport system substrate-binding protein [Hydrogenivirga caldilitoris]
MRITTEVKLGAFVLATSLAFAFLILTFGEIPLFKPSTKSYVVYFKDVGGLSIGAEVRVSGIRAGKVEDITLEDSRVKVVFNVDKRIKLFRDTSATIGTLGLMGDKYLAINPGTPESGELPEGGAVKTAEGVADTDRLIRELTRTAESFKLVAENLNRMLEENRRNLKDTLENLNALTATLRRIAEENQENLKVALAQMAQLTESLNRTLPEAIASIDRLADELSGIASENREDIRILVSNLRSVSSELKGELPRLVENLNSLSSNLNEVVKENRVDLKTSIRNLSEITQRLKTTSGRLDNILAKVESGEGTLGKLVTDEELYRSVSKGAKLFGEAGDVITRTKVFVGFGGELYSGGDTKGYMSLRIEPDRNTYYLAEVVGDSRGRVYTEEIVGNGEVVKKEFKPEFTLQIAKKFYVGEESYLSVRAGLKESTGGVGFDFSPSERIKLYSDIWDTGRKDRPEEEDLKPNLQVGIQLRLKGPLYTRFGGDDLLNDKLRGAFVGVGLEFSEEYLKYLLGGMGLPFP